MIDLIINWWNIGVLIVGVSISIWFRHQYRQTKSRALLTSLPGVWTSLGLLGTFIAICGSLHDLQDTQIVIDNTGKTLKEVQLVGSQNLDIMKVIKELIPAFTTSIIGLLGALFETIRAKYIFSKEEKTENDKLHNLSPEEYIRDIAKSTQEMTQLQIAQGEKNKEYNDKLNKNIVEQNKVLQGFIDGFVNRMDEIFQQMHGAIQQQVQTFGEEQFSKTSDILSTIAQRMESVSTGIIEQQSKSISDMMKNTNTELDSIADKVSDGIGSLSDKIQKALTDQSGQLSDIISQYDSLATRLAGQNGDLAEKITAQMQSDYEKIQENNTANLKMMEDLKESYRSDSSAVMKSAIEMNQNITDNLRIALNDLVSDLKSSISTECATLSDEIKRNVESLQKAYQFVESLIAEIKQNYDQSVIAYSDAVNTIHRSNENTEKAITATSRSLELVKETNEKVEEILSVLTHRQDEIEQLTKQISSVSSAIVQLQKLESTLNKIANK